MGSKPRHRCQGLQASLLGFGSLKLDHGLMKKGGLQRCRACLFSSPDVENECPDELAVRVAKVKPQTK